MYPKPSIARDRPWRAIKPPSRFSWEDEVNYTFITSEVNYDMGSWMGAIVEVKVVRKNFVSELGSKGSVSKLVLKQEDILLRCNVKVPII